LLWNVETARRNQRCDCRPWVIRRTWREVNIPALCLSVIFTDVDENDMTSYKT